MAFTYEFPRPAIATDCLVFCFHEKKLKILLIQRDKEPFEGNWAIPGGFLEIEEDLPDSAKRELKEETGVEVQEVTQFQTFGSPDRDPRERTVSVAFYAFVKSDAIDRLQSGSDARNAQWFDINDLPSLAFDHDEIIQCCLQHLRSLIWIQPFGMELLPDKFIFDELKALYEVILNEEVDGSKLESNMKVFDLISYDAEDESLIKFSKTQYHRLKRKEFLLMI